MPYKSLFYKQSTLNLSGKIIDLSIPKVMGILNITPDSFYDGGKYIEESALIAKVNDMVSDGMSILDIGGQSSRPGSHPISEEEELRRIIPTVKIIRDIFPELPISIDTYRANVAYQAINAGANIINDISSGEIDERMVEVIADLKCPYIIMHMKGRPNNMQDNPVYEDIVTEIMEYFIEKLKLLSKYEIHDVILDPGFGFGKTISHNYTLLSRLNEFEIFERPILVGISRKTMVTEPTQSKPKSGLIGTVAANTLALSRGANILRVHDVKEAVQTIQIYEIYKQATK